ncbi:unnamed protein product [Ambrosiozyma monospora]|uniref:Unnamed protein product n=1 Tax=Ambrosiozyma monospora TaxID=43982 RepID=A0ACB5TDD8_AMBMO|nr:unnamed protein product [Ambrosiozyma monospora]
MLGTDKIATFSQLREMTKVTQVFVPATPMISGTGNVIENEEEINDRPIKHPRRISSILEETQQIQLHDQREEIPTLSSQHQLQPQSQQSQQLQPQQQSQQHKLPFFLKSDNPQDLLVSFDFSKWPSLFHDKQTTEQSLHAFNQAQRQELINYPIDAMQFSNNDPNLPSSDKWSDFSLEQQQQFESMRIKSEDANTISPNSDVTSSSATISVSDSSGSSGSQEANGIFSRIQKEINARADKELGIPARRNSGELSFNRFQKFYPLSIPKPQQEMLQDPRVSQIPMQQQLYQQEMQPLQQGTSTNTSMSASGDNYEDDNYDLTTIRNESEKCAPFDEFVPSPAPAQFLENNENAGQGQQGKRQLYNTILDILGDNTWEQMMNAMDDVSPPSQ